MPIYQLIIYFGHSLKIMGYWLNLVNKIVESTLWEKKSSVRRIQPNLLSVIPYIFFNSMKDAPKVIS